MKKSLLFIIIAGILWGTSGIFVTFLSPYGFTSLQLTAVRGLVSFLCIASFALLVDRSLFRMKLRDIIFCLGIGICLFATATLYFISMQKTTISTAVVLMYTAPIYVIILSVPLLREKAGAKKLISIAVMLIGCVFVSGILSDANFNTAGILAGLGSGVTYGAYNILTKIAIKRGIKPISITLYAFLFMSAIAISVCSPAGIITSAAKAPGITIPLLLGIGIFTFVLPYLLYTLAMKGISASAATSLSIIEPMAATLFSIIIFKEQLSFISACGIILILVATVLIGKSEEKNG